MRRALSLLLPLLALSSSCQCGLDPLAAVPGRVAGVICRVDDGLPATGVTVELAPSSGPTLDATTNEGGNFLIDRVPAGAAVLTIIDAEDNSGVPRTIAVDVHNDATTIVEDTACRDVPPGPGFGDIVGTVCNRHTGGFVTAATVRVQLDDGSALETTTDDAGRFQLWNVPIGPRVVSISGDGFQKSWLVEVQEGVATTLPSEGECRVGSAEEGALSGVLCDPAGAGVLSGALVTVTDADQRRFTELTDVDGAFFLAPLAPGEAEVLVERGGEVLLHTSALIVAGEEAHVSDGGGCVDEQCVEQLVQSEGDARIELVLVVDRSGSMALGAPGYGSTRWRGVTAAIKGVAAQLQSRVAFGLALYPSTDSNECGTADGLAIEPGFDNAVDIAAVLDDFYSEPVGATPTAAALSEVRAWHVAHPPDRPRVVLLATDGGPNCNAALDPFSCVCSSGDSGCFDTGTPELCLDDDNAVSAVSQLRAAGLSTYVVGIPGVENFGYVLDRMAEAGGTERFFLARDVAALETAIGEIGRRAGGCSIAVDDALDVARAARLEVSVGGTELLRDPSHQDGFDVIDEHHLELYGSACEAWLASGALELGVCTVDGGTP